MASSGWQGEQVVYTFGAYGRFVGDIYIGSIKRNTDNIQVSGSVRLGCRGSNMWYANRIAISVDNGSQGVKIKGWTSGAILTGTNYDVPFSATIPCSQTATAANITVHYDDQQAGSGWMHSTNTWTLSFPQAIRKPKFSCGNTYSNNPSVWRVKSGVSGIDWGIGYNSRTLTADVSYTFQGTSYSYRAGTWTDGATSKEIDINKYSATQPWVNGLPAGANVTITWTATTNIGSVSCSSSVACKAPDTPTLTTITTSNPSVYRLASTVSGVNYGDYHKSTSLYAKVTGTIDGKTISWTTTPITTSATSGSFDYNALTNDPSAPWLKVPDDETVTVSWYAVIDVGYTTLTGMISKTQYCQKSYTAYVIETGVNSGNPVEADLFVSPSTGSKPTKEIRRINTIAAA